MWRVLAAGRTWRPSVEWSELFRSCSLKVKPRQSLGCKIFIGINICEGKEEEAGLDRGRRQIMMQALNIPPPLLTLSAPPSPPSLTSGKAALQLRLALKSFLEGVLGGASPQELSSGLFSEVRRPVRGG